MSSDCIIYPGTLTDQGYGYTSFWGKGERAHRIAWMQEYGPIPNGLHVLHSCDNRPCINIKHLRLGTHQDNMRDMVLRNRTHKSTLERCSAGHTFAKYNTFLDQEGVKQCKSCDIAERKRQLPTVRMQTLREALCI